MTEDRNRRDIPAKTKRKSRLEHVKAAKPNKTFSLRVDTALLSKIIGALGIA